MANPEPKRDIRLPDVHILKYNADGKIELIQAVFGCRQQGPIWPD